MMKYEFLKLIDILGIAAFSISGVYAAMEKKLDIFGIFIIAAITALGGGTIRDMLIGDVPVGWMHNTNYGLIILISAVIAILFKNIIHNFKRTLLVFDSLGLGFFTVLGIQKGMALGLHPGICVALGTITGCFGGVIRDISLNNIPLIFQKEIYATACIFGGSIYILLSRLGVDKVSLEIICILAIFLIRIIVVKYKLSLPGIYGLPKNEM